MPGKVRLYADWNHGTSNMPSAPIETKTHLLCASVPLRLCVEVFSHQLDSESRQPSETSAGSSWSLSKGGVLRQAQGAGNWELT